MTPTKAYWLFLRATAAIILVALFGYSGVVLGQAEQGTETPQATENFEAEAPSAPVEVDGRILFHIRGVSAFPAEDRAAAIAERIRAVASNPTFSPSDIRTMEMELGTEIFAGNQRLMIVSEPDAQLASLPRKALADLYVNRIQTAVGDYRNARSRSALTRSIALAGAATGILIALVALIIWLSRRLLHMLDRRYHQRIHAVGIQSFHVVRAEQIWNALKRLISGGRVVVILGLVFIYLSYVLALFPWTRATGSRLRGYLLSPLVTMGTGILGHFPALIFLVVLFFVIRFALRLVHRFFDALKKGEVKLSGFDAEWAESTYKLVRLGIVILALVVAYPYVPGSRSEAFKGLTIFLGLVFSLGSSSAIANLIAGYTMTYRRAFRLGDRVKIGDTMGDVTEMRLQVTHLKTVKNEEVIIPNSSILNNEVINYSTLARKTGLILHTTVGIGYETPWRQVEAMLLMAAERTGGLLKEPPPFVLQKALGDFAVTYEINVYCDNPQAMAALYTALHRNVLDLFNEYGVQIMTPAYEGDPEVPKVVPKDQWFVSPAQTGAQNGAPSDGGVARAAGVSATDPEVRGNHDVNR